MSISSFTMVTMLDTRPSPITISMPRTVDIPNRVIEEWLKASIVELGLKKSTNIELSRL